MDVWFDFGLVFLVSTYELKKLRLKFDSFDTDKSGSIEYGEFADLLKEDRGILLESLFNLVDLNKSGSISFSEYVQAIGSYCLFSKHQILEFLFNIFDKDDSGSLDEQEFKDMLLVINNKKPNYLGSFKIALAQVDRDGDKLIDLGELTILNDKYPLLAYPAFRMQSKMQQATLGVHTWTDIMRQKHQKEVSTKLSEQNNGAIAATSVSTRMTHFVFGKRQYS